MQHGVAIHKSHITRHHYPVAVFPFAPVEHVIGIGQSYLTQRRRSIKTTGPDHDMARIITFVRRRADAFEAAFSENSSVLFDTVLHIVMDTGEKRSALLRFL